MEHTHHDTLGGLVSPWDEYEFDLELGKLKVSIYGDGSHSVVIEPDPDREVVLQQTEGYLPYSIELRLREVY